jgi:hypothetical protein
MSLIYICLNLMIYFLIYNSFLFIKFILFYFYEKINLVIRFIVCFIQKKNLNLNQLLKVFSLLNFPISIYLIYYKNLAFLLKYP